MKLILQKILKVIGYIGFPITYLSGLWLKLIKLSGKSSFNNSIFRSIGVFPILDHYYQPLVNPKKHLRKSLREDRILKGIDFNIEEQLQLLSQFHYNDELLLYPLAKTDKVEYYYNNTSYLSGDSEYLYNIVRHYKPQNIIEIGSGASTLMVKNATDANKKENTLYACNHICIEPYEQFWLEQIGVEVLRERVEDFEISYFQKLQKNDILFIDSSHIIRPQGDVLYEYLEILPTLKSGVLVHIHDIFSPKDYLDEWIFEEHFLWDEQYLLEAFLMFNSEFKVLGSLNYLTHNYRKELSAVCPVFSQQKDREPGSFWMVKK